LKKVFTSEAHLFRPAWKDYLYRRKTDKKILRRIQAFV